MNLNMLFFKICAEFEVKKHSVSSFYKQNNFKPCLTKQLLNMKVICPAQSLNFFQVSVLVVLRPHLH